MVYSIFLLLIGSSGIAMENKKKLVLHLDVNRTIVALDSAQGKDPEEFCNAALTEYTEHSWDGSNKKSFYDYTIEQIAQEHPSLKKSSDEFKNIKNQRLLNFSGYLKQHYPQMHEQFQNDLAQMLAVAGSKELKLYPSVYPLIDYLQQRGNYCLALRTFGNDGQQVANILKKEKGLPFNIKGKFDGPQLCIEYGDDDETLSTSQDIYNAFAKAPFQSKSQNTMLVQDDYSYWKNKGKFEKHGKLFPIDIHNEQVVSLFADDNAGEKKRTGRAILHPQAPDGTPIPEEKLIESGHIIPVNRKMVILDTNYLVDIVKKMDQ